MQSLPPAGKREQDRLRHLRKYAETGYRARILLNNAKARAGKHGVPFSLTHSWIEEQLLGGRCAMTGLPFVFEEASAKRGSGNMHPWAPSLDRIVPEAGYTPSNTRAVVWLFNAAKHIGSDADVLILAEALCSTH